MSKLFSSQRTQNGGYTFPRKGDSLSQSSLLAFPELSPHNILSLKILERHFCTLRILAAFLSFQLPRIVNSVGGRRFNVVCLRESEFLFLEDDGCLQGLIYTREEQRKCVVSSSSEICCRGYMTVVLFIYKSKKPPREPLKTPPGTDRIRKSQVEKVFYLLKSRCPHSQALADDGPLC